MDYCIDYPVPVPQVSWRLSTIDLVLVPVLGTRYLYRVPGSCPRSPSPAVSVSVGYAHPSPPRVPRWPRQCSKPPGPDKPSAAPARLPPLQSHQSSAAQSLGYVPVGFLAGALPHAGGDGDKTSSRGSGGCLSSSVLRRGTYRADSVDAVEARRFLHGPEPLQARDMGRYSDDQRHVRRLPRWQHHHNWQRRRHHLLDPGRQVEGR